jgi:hypothetical protein
MSITKFMVSVGPIHENDLSDVVKRLEHFPEIRVSTYDSQKPKRVVSTKTPIVRKTVTPEAIEQMQKLRDNKMELKKIAEVTGYSLVTVQRHTHERIKEITK